MKHKRLWKRGLWAVLILILVVAAAATALYGPARKIARLAARDEERVLRSDVRPAKDKRVLVFAFDGVGAEQLKRAIEGGYLPTIAQYLGGPQSKNGVFLHGYSAPNVYSVLPSTTLAAWSATWTGKPAAENGVPGNEWFERETMTFKAPAPVSLSSSADTVHMLTDDLVGQSLMAHTLFERANRKSFVSLSAIYRGADMFTAPGSHALLGLMSDARNLVARGEGSKEAYSEIDDESAEVVVENLERRGLPDLQVVYFPGVDLWTHVAPKPQDDQLDYMRKTLDHSMAQVIEVYGRQNAIDDTTILLVADHGHTEVLKDDRHALDTGGDDEPTAVLEREGFRMRPRERETSNDEFQAVVAYQGAMAYVYLADRSTCPKKNQRCDWLKPPRFEEDVLAVARAFHRATQSDGPIPALRGTLDLVFARRPAPVGQPAAPFEIFDGEKLAPIAQYLAKHPRPDLIHLEERMDALSAGPYGHRAGDVLLLAKASATQPVEERFYFSDKTYTSWHGSPSARDSTIPLVLIRKTATGEELKEELHRAVGPNPSQLSVTPLIMQLLGGKPPLKAREARER